MIETRADIEKLLCEQLELLAEKSKKCHLADLPAFATAMLDVGDYLISCDFDMDTKFEDGEMMQIPKQSGWRRSEEIRRET